MKLSWQKVGSIQTIRGSSLSLFLMLDLQKDEQPMLKLVRMLKLNTRSTTTCKKMVWIEPSPIPFPKQNRVVSLFVYWREESAVYG